MRSSGVSVRERRRHASFFSSVLAHVQAVRPTQMARLWSPRIMAPLRAIKRLPVHWLMLGVTGILFVVVWAFVDLTPRVDAQFFFSSDDPQLQESNAIDRRFPSGSQLILSVSAPDIASERYVDRLRTLTQRVAATRGVSGVRSLADGPKDLKDAEDSPLWN